MGLSDTGQSTQVPADGVDPFGPAKRVNDVAWAAFPSQFPDAGKFGSDKSFVSGKFLLTASGILVMHGGCRQAKLPR